MLQFFTHYFCVGNKGRSVTYKKEKRFRISNVNYGVDRLIYFMTSPFYKQNFAVATGFNHALL